MQLVADEGQGVSKLVYLPKHSDTLNHYHYYYKIKNQSF